MIFIVTGSFILFDVITGFLKAIKKKIWSSSIMRTGLFHKAGFILCVVLAVLCDFGQQFLDIGYTVPLTKIICIYVIVTEIGSSIENLSAINPAIIPAKLKAYFLKIPSADK